MCVHTGGATCECLSNYCQLLLSLYCFLTKPNLSPNLFCLDNMYRIEQMFLKASTWFDLSVACIFLEAQTHALKTLKMCLKSAEIKLCLKLNFSFISQRNLNWKNVSESQLCDCSWVLIFL